MPHPPIRCLLAGVAAVTGLAGALLLGEPLAAPAAGAVGAEGEPSATDGVVVTTDVTYGAAPDETGALEVLRLDLYDPAAVLGTRPALVMVHGGGFSQGDKADPVYAAMGRAFAEQGLVVASVNYRLRPDRYPDFPVASLDAQHDVQAAVRWMRAHAGELRIDPGRIAVTGHSAGAIAALRVGTHPDDPGESGTPDQPSGVAGVLAVSGFLADDVGAATPPLRMLHGTDDVLVPLGWAHDTCRRWTVAGGGCDLVTYEGATHDATGFFDPAAAEVTEFLTCTVGGPVAFADVVPGTAMAQTVAWSTGVEVLNGSVTSALGPDHEVTRGQFAAWTWRWSGRPAADTLASTATSPAIDWAVDAGVLHARRDRTFGATQGVTRAAAALALWRLAGRPADEPPVSVPGLDPGAKYAPAMHWLAAHGTDALSAGGTFRPDAPLRRVQLLRLLRNLSFAPGASDEPPAAARCA